MRYKAPYTLYKRGKVYYFRTYDKRGVRTHGLSTGCTSKTAAKNFCDKLLASGQLSADTNIKFKSFAEDFFSPDGVYVRDRATLTETTVRSYQSINRLLIDYFGEYKLTDITNSMVKSFRLTLLDQDYSVKYTNTSTTVLDIILTQAYNDMIIERNPCSGLPPIQDTSKGRDAFTLEEVISLYKAVPDDLKRYIVALSLTGLRIREYMSISPKNVQRTSDVNYIHLTQQIDSRGVLVPLKTKKERDIPVIKELIPYLENNLDYQTLRARMKPFFELIPGSKERKLTFHSLRHFFVTNAKAYGVNPLIVETVAGHSLKGMEGIYTNFKIKDCTAILDWQKQVYKKITSI